MRRPLGLLLLVALISISAFCWATDHVRFTHLAPSEARLFISNADGSGERALPCRVRSTTIPHGLRVVIGLCLRRSVPARPIFIGFISTGLVSIDSPTTPPMKTKDLCHPTANKWSSSARVPREERISGCWMWPRAKPGR
jgi:hypothetical protein